MPPAVDPALGNPFFRVPITFSVALLFFSIAMNRSLPETFIEMWHKVPGVGPRIRPAADTNSADYIFHNASIWTGDVEKPWAEMLAVKGDHIVWTGRSWAEEEFTGPNTQKVDLQGAFVAPGLIDSHLHFIDGGLQLSQLDLKGIRSKSEFTAAVAGAVAQSAEGQWVLGRGWDHERWGGDLPDSSWVDHVSPKNPVWLPRIDGHMGLANRVALDKVGIGKGTPEPEGGSIVRDHSGNPTGLLKETAMPLLIKHIPRPSREERQRAVQLASEHALAHGVTAVGDMGSFAPGDNPADAWDDLVYVYGILAEAKELSVRVYSFVPLDCWSKLKQLIAKRGRELGGFLRWGGLKAYADGSLGSSTAYFHEPYADGDGKNRGLQVTDPKWLQEKVTEADKAGLQVAIHAIGDAAVDSVLNMYIATADANGRRKNRRWRIEHAQHVSLGAPARFSALEVIASPQPQHLLDDAPYAERRLGMKRAEESSYVFGTFLDHEVPLAFGSDWTVAALDPLLGIYAATWRTHPLENREPWIAKQQITSEQALVGYTRSAAYSIMWDDKIGTLEKGKLADFVVLSESPLKRARTEELPEVLRTYVGGKCMVGCEVEVPTGHEEL